MKVVSCFSGVEGLGLGLERAGFTVAMQIERDPQCLSVLARHFPDTQRIDDITEAHGDRYCPDGGCGGCVAAPDVVVGGFPCQDLSVAGRRAGLGGARSGLWWEMWRLLAQLRPRWVLVENVPGLLSAVCPDPDTGKPVPGGACDGGCMAAHGGAMGTFLGSVAGLGYGFAWRVLDARNFGLAQRRRRLFVVLHAGADRGRAAQVLLEPERCSGGAPPGEAEGQDVAGCLGGGTGSRGLDDTDRTTFVPEYIGTLTSTHNGMAAPQGSERDHLLAVGFPTQGTDGEGTFLDEAMPPLTGSHGDGMVAQALTTSGQRNDATTETLVPFAKVHRATSGDDAETWGEADVACTLNGHDTSRPNEMVPTLIGVRRLTPLERERVQGFPDDWTRWGHDGKEMSVTTRERMTGNAVPVPVAEWIGRRIVAVEAGELAA